MLSFYNTMKCYKMISFLQGFFNELGVPMFIILQLYQMTTNDTDFFILT